MGARRREHVSLTYPHTGAQTSRRYVAEQRASGRSIFTSGSLISRLSARQPEEATLLYAMANTEPSAFSLHLLLSSVRVFLFLLRLSYVTSNLYVLHATVCTSFLPSFLSFFFFFFFLSFLCKKKKKQILFLRRSDKKISMRFVTEEEIVSLENYTALD